MSFPPGYPYSPPTFRFLTKMWHPNIYEVRATAFQSLITLILFSKRRITAVDFLVRRCMYFNFTSPGGRSAKWRTTFRTMEPNTDC